MSLPMSLAYAVNRINTFSTNYFRLETVNQSTASQFGVITLNLPVNSILNLKSLSLHMNARANEAAIDLGGGDTLITTLPRIDQLISRIELYAGGIQISSGFQQYNTVSSVMKNMYTELQRETSYDRVLINDEINTTDTTYYQKFRPYILNNFLSFIGESSPDYLDTSLMPNIQLRIYLTGPEVLGAYQTSTGAGTALSTDAQTKLLSDGKFELKDLHFTCETITFADNMYDKAMEMRIKDSGFLEVPFANYYTFFQTNTSMDQSTRFSLSAQSINKLIAVVRPSDYREKPKGLVKINDRMGSTFQPSYFNFLSGGIGSWQFNVNNLYMPNYRATPLDAFNLLTVAKADNYDSSAGCKINSLDNWYKNFWMAVVRLNLPMGGMDSRNCSGLSSLGLASQFFYQTSADSNDPLQTILTNNEVTIIACVTSTLKIGAGRQITVDI